MHLLVLPEDVQADVPLQVYVRVIHLQHNQTRQALGDESQAG